MFLQTLFLISLLAVLIYAFKSPQPRKMLSYPLKVSNKDFKKLFELANENNESIKAITKSNEEKHKYYKEWSKSVDKKNAGI